LKNKNREGFLFGIIIFMKDFWLKNRAFVGILAATVVLLVGGVFLFTRGGNFNVAQGKIDESLLVPTGAEITSGIVNGEYLPASPSATVTLVEFSDYQCPACGAYHPLVKQLLSDFAGKLNFVFRNYPLSYHPDALAACLAVEAAGLQGKYWQMHDKIFETQATWSTSTDAKEIFLVYAKELNLDIGKFTQDLESAAVKNKVESDYNDGVKIGITETPTFYLNDRKLTLTGSADNLKNAIQNSLEAK
jgi:protein-disulfide isomerase